MSDARRFEVVILAATVLGLIFYTMPGFEALGEAETEVVPEEAPPTVAEEETLGPGEALATVEITPTGLISFDFREAPVRDVLRLFAQRVNINIVATPSVTGTVSMKLDNVKWRKALELILDVNKLKLTEDKENNIIKVMTQEEVSAEPMTTKIYSLSYLQAADYEVVIDTQKKTVPGAATILKPLLAESETIQADSAGNKLVVHAIPASHDIVESVLKELDKEIKQVLIEVKFIEASTEAGKEVGIKWDFMRAYGVEAFGPGTDTKLERMGRSYIKEKVTTDSSSSALADSRYVTKAVSDSTAPTATSLATSDDTWTNSLTTGADRGMDTSKTITKYATLSPDNVRLVLSALMENSDAKLVSNPRISTVDNKLATIKAVQQFPIPNWTFNGDTGTWEVQGFEFKDIGITLRVTPHINQDGFITLDVDPEVSSQVGTVTFGGGGGGTAEIPIVNVRTATTRVMVRTGETLVIGGLVRSDEVLRKSGLPLLKDLPLVGSVLFGHTSKILRSMDLMVFITPTIVEGPAAGILAPSSTAEVK